MNIRGILTVLFALLDSERDYDPEQFADQELPILIVGTKLVSGPQYHNYLPIVLWLPS